MKRFKQLLSNQRFIYWFILISLVVPNVMMFFTESTSLMTRVVQIILPFTFYWWVMTLSPKPGKMFWVLFIVAFFDAFEIVLLKLYGETPIAVDMFLNVTTTNATEVNELLFNILPAMLFAVILYSLCIILSIVSIRGKAVLDHLFRVNQRKMALAALAVAVIATVANYFITPGFRARNDLFPIDAAYNMGLAGNRLYRTTRYPVTSAGFSYHATCNLPDTMPMITVIVIGETARADNFGIYGYDRPTTPRLAAMGDSLAIYRDVITMSNTTHKSVPLLLSPVGSEQWDSLYYRKGIISAFREAGYKSAYYSNQRRNHSFIDFFGEEADDVVFTKDSVLMTENVSDDALKRLVRQRLDNYDGHRLLIVVHCYGSHFNYKDRYPAEGAVFKPDDVIAADADQRDILINSYDNTIRFDDNLLGDIIDMLKEKDVPSLLAFTSDHGEDIFDDERDRFLHASPLPTYYQLRVPLFFWASQQYRDAMPQQWRHIMEHRDIAISSNMVLFHTMLDLSGVTTTMLKTDLALSNADFKPFKRLYVNDHNEYRPLDSVGLKKQDIEQFNKHKMSFP